MHALREGLHHKLTGAMDPSSSVLLHSIVNNIEWQIMPVPARRVENRKPSYTARVCAVSTDIFAADHLGQVLPRGAKCDQGAHEQIKRFMSSRRRAYLDHFPVLIMKENSCTFVGALLAPPCRSENI